MTSAFRRSSVSPFRSRNPPPPPSTSSLRTATPSSSSSASLYSRQLAPPPPAKAKESVTVPVRFRPLREIGKGDEVAWYADGDSTVPNEFNSDVSYGFGYYLSPLSCTYIRYGRTSVIGELWRQNKGTYVEGIKEEVVLSPSLEAVKVIEVINDLLLRIREDSQGTYVEGIKEEVVLLPSSVAVKVIEVIKCSILLDKTLEYERNFRVREIRCMFPLVQLRELVPRSSRMV